MTVPSLEELEALARGAPAPEYVLAFMPSWLCASLWRRVTEPAYWELHTLAGYNAGEPCRDDWRTPDCQRWTVPLLAEWAGSLVGFPVALQEDCAMISTGGRGSRWHRVPLYWVLRNT